MAKKFKGFSDQQAQMLLKEYGFKGRPDKDEMDAFLASNPRAAAGMNQNISLARKRVEGRANPEVQSFFPGGGVQAGGEIPSWVDPNYGYDPANPRKPNTREMMQIISGKSLEEIPINDRSDISKQATEALYVGSGSKLDASEFNKNMSSIVSTATGTTATDTAATGTTATGTTATDTAATGTAATGTTATGTAATGTTATGTAATGTAATGTAATGTTATNLYSGKFTEDISKYILAMATGSVSQDLQFDFNGDGKISSEDALTALKKAEEEGNYVDPAKEESERIRLEKERLEKERLEKERLEKEDKVVSSTTSVIGKGELDAAQKAYADAQKALTDAQTALSGATEPQPNPFTLPADLEAIATTYLSSDANDKYDIGFDTYHSDGVGRSGVMGADVKAILESGRMPADPTKYGEGEPTGSKDNWTFTYDNGQTVVIRTDDPDDAVFRFNKLANMLTDFKESDLYKGNKSAEQTAYEQLTQNVTDAELLVTQTQADVSAAQKRFETTEIPSTSEALGKTITDPTALSTEADVDKLTEETNQLIGTEKGQLDEVSDAAVKIATAKIANDIVADSANTYTAITSQSDVTTALEKLAAATGTPSEGALSKAETMLPSELAQLGLDPATTDTIRQIPEIKRSLDAGELPTAELFNSYTRSEAQQFDGEVGEIEAAKFASDTPQATAQVDYNLTPTEIAAAEATKVQDAAAFSEYATAQEKQSEFVPSITAETNTIAAEELVDLNKILNNEAVIVTGKTLDALNEASTAKAASASFTQQLEAKAVKGEVSAQSTVSFQLEKLMESFNDGTPAWAAGALRNVNAAMNARGLGGSSMAAAAMIQASMESAIPIAQADASIFQAMDMENVRNAQAVSLANAAAAQNFELANLSNRQAVNIQNSMNNANLSLRNLSNTQEAVLASAQFKAALQGQELSISSNVSLANAARYAQVNDINLTNRQQTSILRSTQALEVEMTNLSNSQQTALSNLQVKAAMMGQELTNEQQVAVLETTQAFETEMQNATRRQQAFIQDAAARAAMEGQVLSNSQQTALFNVGNEVSERGIELNNEQQATMFNMTNKMTMDVEDLSNRQQTALANAQIEAAMKGQELTNKQQVNIVRSERIAEIANMQFTADQQTAVRNSELAQTVDLANLSNVNAKVLADAASMSQVDVTNLDNRQQAAQQKAAAFLTFDVEEMSNEQQLEIFKGQSTVQSIFSDQAADNAQLQFNAESTNQTNQFFASLDSQVDMFSVAQENAIRQFNAGEENALSKFNAELGNQRDMFNASNELVIAQANTQWRQSIATTNTAAENQANMAEAMAANNLTTQGINELWQQERDLMEYAWTSAEKQMDRTHELAKAKIVSDGDGDAAFSTAAGNLLSSVVTAWMK